MRSNFVTTIIAVALTACTQTEAQPDLVVISVIGSNDSHGELVRQGDRAGMTTLSGYVAALRTIRAEGGDVLLVSAGDMWQGTLESNLNEGASVVDAYNAMGYAASAIGNHEFDFGPVGPKSIPEDADDDPQGALRRNAMAADFPLLAANLIDARTGRMIEWENVEPSVMTSRAGVDIGIIGVSTSETAATTIAANVANIAIAPLADAVVVEAKKLRAAGAVLVIVLAHAGSECVAFDDPYDLSSCNMDDEIMQVANAIPAGLVDHIVAGHRHRGIAHFVNGIAVTAGYSNTRAFSRVDFTVDRRSGQVVERRIHPPTLMCSDDPCIYEGIDVAPMPEVARIAAEASEVAAQRRAARLGVFVETPFTLRSRPEDSLGNLFTTAVLEMKEADISIHNVWGGIRAELPDGELTFGDVFRVFPFDNRITVTELSGADVRQIFARQAHNRYRAAGFAGMRVFVQCNDGQLSVRMVREDGSEIADDDRLRVVTNDFLLLGGDGILTPVTPDGGFEIPHGTPLVRDTLVQWFRDRGGRINAAEFLDASEPRWNLPDELPESCVLPGA